MRASHILAALGASTLAQAQDTSPIPDAVAQATDCTTTTSLSTTWTLPIVSATSTHPANFTLTVDHSPANATGPESGAGGTTTTTADGTTTGTAGSSVSPSSSVAAAAAPGEGLSTDSSMLGLVVFFALSLCLL